MRLRRRFARDAHLVGLGVWLCACSAARPNPPATESTPITQPEPPPLASNVVRTRSNEALIAAIRPDALITWLGRMGEATSAGALARMERDLGLVPGDLTGPRPFGHLGMDPSRSVMVESFQLDDDASDQTRRLRRLDAQLADDAIADALTNERSRRTGWFLTRVEVPTLPGASVAATVERALAASGASHWQSPIDGLDVLGFGSSLWTVRTTPTTVVVGIAIGHRDLTGSDMRGAVSALEGWEGARLPALDRNDIMIELRPAPLAEAGFWLDARRVVDVAPDDGVEPGFARRILAVGFREATQALRIDAPDGSPRYERLTLIARDDRLTIRSSLREGVEPLEALTWQTDGATSADIDFHETTSAITVNGSLLYAWPLLPKTSGINPFRGRDAITAMREAGVAGVFELLGDGPFVGARVEMEGAEPIGQATLPFMRRFERLGVAGDRATGVPVFAGLLAADAKEAEAACVLAPEPTKCRNADRLPASGLTSRKGFFIDRKLVDGRWLIRASANKQALANTSITVKKGGRPAMQGRFDVDGLLGVAPNVFGRWNVALRMMPDARSFEVTCARAPRAP